MDHNIEPNLLRYLCDLTYNLIGIKLDGSKSYLINNRLLSMAIANNFENVSDFIESLRFKPYGKMHMEVALELATHETYFFRDQHIFDGLYNLLNNHYRDKPMIRIWSCACSTGQEPYSLAMMVRDLQERSLAGCDVKIVATDVCQKTLDYASKGLYNNVEMQRGLSDDLKTKYFVQRGNHYEIKDNVKSMVDFKPVNLLHSFETMPSFDFVMLRNVLIYFDSELKQNIITRIEDKLKPEGSLILGCSENLLGLRTKLRLQMDKNLHLYIK